MKHRIDPLILAELRRCTAPWELRQGTRHLQIFINGRMVGIIPHGGYNTGNKRPSLNIRAQIRRFIKKELQG